MFDISYQKKYHQIKNESYDEVIINENPIKIEKESKKYIIIERKNFILKDKKDFIKRIIYIKKEIIRIIYIKKELIGFILFFISYFYYYLSLEPCLKGEASCSLLYNWQLTKVYQELKSCCLIAFMLELTIYKFLSKLHLIHFFLAFILFYIYSHGIVFEDHGFYNFFYFFIITIIIIIFIIPFNILFYIFNKKSKIGIFIYILSLIIIIYFAYSFIYIKGLNCDDWGKGLNETFIINNNSKYACEIQIPKKCSYKLFQSFQDYSKILGKNCTKLMKKQSIENLIKNSKSPFITNKTKRFGYPLSNKDPCCIKEKSRNILQENFLNNLVDMDNKQILDKYFKNKFPEVLVDFTDNNKGKIEIDVHHDKKLSQERKLLEKNSEPLSNNVLIIYIDSVSRQNSIRELKKTLKFFEKFMPYEGGKNEKYPNEKYHSFQFFKYHAFKGYTCVNYPFLFYGQKREVKNKSLITKYFKKNGFITSLAHDLCFRDTTNCYHEFNLDEVFDHEFILCDPHKEHFNTNSIRCLYGKLDIEHLLNYSEQFWRKYPENRKFSLIVSNYGHEGTLKVIKYIDKYISNFLMNLFNDNLLKNSIVFLISDHGVEMTSIYYIDKFYQIEGKLPMLYILVSDKKNSSYDMQYKYIHENQQNFITAFDFYNTLGNIIFGNKYKYIKNNTSTKETCKSPYGESLFNKINNNKIRYPKNFNKISEMSLIACK